MEIYKYIKEAWDELWNPDNRIWQYIDRILFWLLPVISLLLVIIPQRWSDMMTNLVWIIPLSIWFLFLLLVVPYRLASKYYRQYKEARSEINQLKDDIQKLAKELDAEKSKRIVSLGIVGAIQGLHAAGMNLKDKLKYYSTLNVYDKGEYDRWYDLVSDTLQKDLSSEYTHWITVAHVGSKPTLDDLRQACDRGVNHLDEIYKRLTHELLIR